MLNIAASPESVLPLPRSSQRSSTTAIWPRRLAIGRFWANRWQRAGARFRAGPGLTPPLSAEVFRIEPAHGISAAAKVSSTCDSHLRALADIVESTVRRSIKAADCHQRAAVHVDAAMYELFLLRQEFEAMTAPVSRPA